MKILITRPEPDAARLAVILQKMGHEGVSAPMMTIKNRPGTKIDVDGVQALLVTSANGARALGRATAFRNVKVFAVGAATAEAVRAEGFSDISSAAGDTASLTEEVIGDCKPENGKLVHVAGTEVAGDLAGDLKAAGFDCDRVVLYDATPARAIRGDVETQIKNGSIAAALFYSPRTAAIFNDIVTKSGLAPKLTLITALCLSKAVAEKLETLPWAGLQIAPEPNQENLLALVTGVKQANASIDNRDKLREQEVADKNSGKTDNQGKGAVPTTDPEGKKNLNHDSTQTVRKGFSATEGNAPAKKSHAGLILVLFVLVFCLGLGLWPLLYPAVAQYLPQETRDIISGRFGVVESTTTAATTDIQAVRDDLQSEYAKLDERVSKLETARPVATGSETATTAPAESSGDMDARVSALATQIEDQQKKLADALAALDQQQAASSGPSPEVQSDLLDLKNSLLDMKTDIARLQGSLTREQETVKEQATQLSSLQGTLKSAADNKAADRAENKRSMMLLAIGQLQRETRGNEPFENSLKQVQSVAPEGIAADLEPLQEIAAKGAPTMTSLRQDFAAIASDISQSAKLPSEETWYGKTLHRIASIVKFRRVDVTDGSDVDAIIARAEQDLAVNDLEKAVTEVQKLTGPAADTAAPWLSKAQTRLTVEQAISGLLEKATTSALATPTQN
ncbi:uroporphyrinogen-III synthase [Sneathiella sp.]|uniref:uroporphyrinogen-III synthase n=1 Tax=Sneathiella sp. TaxID=1964365 RepID=UPI003561E6FE